MCGINGMVSIQGNQRIRAEVILRMRDIMFHRGPDDAGIYLSEGIGLGSRRLAILDLSTQGHMPMASQDKRYWITYNGEVYNYRELRDELITRGVRFRSQTDTEVILELYCQFGPEMLNRLNGMFAIAIWDQQERQLFLARDRMGIKPLFYSYYNGIFYFGSEEKALFTAGVPVIFDHDCWEELLCFRFIAGEHTIFKGVDRLLPGHYMVIKNGQMTIHRWWNMAEKIIMRREDFPDNPSKWYREMFDGAILGRMISDVPLGVLLSGGLDSSSVAASVALQAVGSVSSFTVRFNEPEYDEGTIARTMVDRYQLLGNELIVEPDQLMEGLKRASWFNNQPLVHSSDSHLLAISQYAKSRVTVLLNGEGSDETLGGYVRYQPLRFPNLLSFGKIDFIQSILAHGNGRKAKLSHFLSLGKNNLLVLYNACEVLPNDLVELGLPATGNFEYRESVLREGKTIYSEDLARQAMYSDQHTFLCSLLDRNDRMTMGASIECREPFLDYRLVEMVASLPSKLLFKGFRTKALLRKSMHERLTREILAHRKWGFGVPWKKYLREIPEFVEALYSLEKTSLMLNSPIETSKIHLVVQKFLKGEDKYLSIVQQLFFASLCWDSIQKGLRMYSRYP